MDLRKLKTLIDLVADSNITELEVTEGEEKVKIVKGGSVSHTPAPQLAPQLTSASPIAATIPAMVAAPAPTAVMNTAPPSGATAESGKIIKSPMVGTFYAAPAPDKPNFVSVGSIVTAAQTVCIIEAMKLLNEIESGFDGSIAEVLVQNGTAVEFGQPLFRLA